MTEDADADGPDGTSRPEIRNPFADSPESGLDDDPTVDHEVDPGDGEPTDGRDVPFAGLAAETRERRRRSEGADDPFERMEVSEIDGDELWESLDDVDLEDAPAGAAERVGETDSRPEHVVNKREYCQRCRYLSDPPDLSCGHEGTDIVEAVDADRFRVRGCPMVTDEGAPTFEDPDPSGTDGP